MTSHALRTLSLCLLFTGLLTTTQAHAGDAGPNRCSLVPWEFQCVEIDLGLGADNPDVMGFVLTVCNCKSEPGLFTFTATTDGGGVVVPSAGAFGVPPFGCVILPMGLLCPGEGPVQVNVEVQKVLPDAESFSCIAVGTAYSDSTQWTLSPNPALDAAAGDAVEFLWTVTNVSDLPATFDAPVVMQMPEGAFDSVVVSPPTDPIMPGASDLLSITAVANDPGDSCPSFGDLLLEYDTDNDGEPEVAASGGARIQTTDPPCPDNSPDLDGDGVVGAADLAGLLSQWGAFAPDDTCSLPWDLLCARVPFGPFILNIAVMDLRIRNNTNVAQVYGYTLSSDDPQTIFFPPAGFAAVPPGQTCFVPVIAACPPEGGGQTTLTAQVTRLSDGFTFGCQGQATTPSVDIEVDPQVVRVESPPGETFSLEWSVTNPTSEPQFFDYALSTMPETGVLSLANETPGPLMIEPGDSTTISVDVAVDSKPTAQWAMCSSRSIGTARGVPTVATSAKVEVLPLCPPRSADLDGDGVVGAADLAILLSAWGGVP